MADNITVTPGTGATILADQVTDGTMGTGLVQMIKIMDATLGGTNKAKVVTGGGLGVSLVDQLAGEDLTNGWIVVAPSTDHANGNQGTLTGLNAQSVTASTNANSASVDCHLYRKCQVTAVGDGTHTLQVKLQTSEDGTNWADVPNSTSAAGAVTTTGAIDICASNVRAVAINGTTTQNITAKMVLHR